MSAGAREKRTDGPAERRTPYRFAQVLRWELKHLLPRADRKLLSGAYRAIRRAAAARAPPTEDRAAAPAYWRLWDTATAALYAGLGSTRRGTWALCLSGGGIRSATFNLGVLQALARRGLLSQFDYISSVSGGGYIAGWFHAWVRRAGALADVVSALKRTPAEGPHRPEPIPLDRLRDFSNYLTPRLGLFSGDWWAAVAMAGRNMLLNWLVVLPATASILALPVIVLEYDIEDRPSGRTLLVAAFLLGVATSFIIHRRRLLRSGGTRVGMAFVTTLPVLASAACLALAGTASQFSAHALDPASVWRFALAWTVAVPLAGWISARASCRAKLEPARWELTGLVISGLATAPLLVEATSRLVPWRSCHRDLYALLSVPLLVGIYLLGRSLFVGIASRIDDVRAGAEQRASPGKEDRDREWWARLSGELVLGALGWVAAVGSAILVVDGAPTASTGVAAWLFPASGDGRGHSVLALLALAWGLLGAGASAGGKSVLTRAAGELVDERARAVAARFFTLERLVMVAAGLALLALFVFLERLDLLAARRLTPQHEVAGLALVLIAGAAISGLAAWCVNVNRFSLHGLYRNRLVRAYLGASHVDRHPDPFTGFDPSDNLPLKDLVGKGPSRSPLPVLDATLNIVRGRRLAWQQRKGESFSMTPLFCGNFHDGYRRTRRYGGHGGLSLGTAMTLSGAAANPNMGYFSSPLVTFVMGLFNARLGAWLPNTGSPGGATFDRPGPPFALLPLARELLGWTDNEGGYVNLSDGGHFENLGLYEMVLRRCRVIVVSDVSQDAENGFQDLGNALRKIRIDLGVRVRFWKTIRIRSRPDTGDPLPGAICALAQIGYREVDAPESGGCRVRNGILVYLKPTLAVDRPPPLGYDVQAYAHGAARFPHESTADQWFSESQFESYRALGEEIASRITDGVPDPSVIEDPLEFQRLLVRAIGHHC